MGTVAILKITSNWSGFVLHFASSEKAPSLHTLLSPKEIMLKHLRSKCFDHFILVLGILCPGLQNADMRYCGIPCS